MYKSYHLRWGNSEAFYPIALPLSKGTSAKFLVSSGYLHEGRIHEIIVAEPLRTSIKNISYTLKKGILSGGKSADLLDIDPHTHMEIISDRKNDIVLEFKCQKSSLSSLYYMATWRAKAPINYTLEYYSRGRWHAFSWAHINYIQGFHSNIAIPQSSRFRMTLHSEEAIKLYLSELHFLK
ncbi:MAG: hypothetical protein HRT88_23740 [Lentisphaeraceae bacterium]|nr:hypothetical protein [Lentisphaeraceae bacterium]